ncbi:zinc finger domain containing protein [Entamoeba histolytica]|uniref:RING-type E3 ubiquitin transferase n=3 Tax=Entamoeba histolytica TaxID=5759 RepID=C4M901_ENTH1|nr:zinc finger domain containing protein [Entamoeba histolytica HM-1:IMSS]EAL48316.2 zinc finger domain containing protein [Entamoeba histolytica HM-1:IMSS]EMD45514.1 zinc finger domain containing protein [Entamoeba histolytica KU27]GAT98108.1 zinc finger domain containing protein [Entamoeba histolytica]|eukprot:XP_653702.2 zinc finger domain containing protein [Entamoeba histolytica HM-1:IMSS]
MEQPQHNSLSMIEQLQNKNSNNSISTIEEKEETQDNQKEIPEEKEEKTEDVEKSTKETGQNQFECLICLDTAQNAVVTQCGHMFCWECLREWLTRQETCPICKSKVTVDSVIPIYNSTTTNDPRGAPRPQGHYTQPPPAPQPNPFLPFFPGGVGGNIATFAIGFGFPGMFNVNVFGGNVPQEQLTPEQIQQRKFQKYLILAFALLPLVIRIIAFLFC